MSKNDPRISFSCEGFETVGKLVPGRYLEACDLEGKDVTVIIDHVVAREKMEGSDRPEQKPVVYFKGAKKGWVLNKTNSRVVAAMHGIKVKGWEGKQITLFATEVKAFGKMKPAIRVRMKK